MTQDEIIEITRQAGGFSPTPEFLDTFAKLVAAKERDACANLCDYIHAEHEAKDSFSSYAEAIRARGEA